MKYTLLIFLCTIALAFKHPFYLSVTDLKYKSDEKVLQGAVKIFINDLEDALTKINKRSIDLINIKDSSSTNKLLKEYLKQRLKIKINELPLNYEYLGFEREEEAVWLYIESKNCPKPKSVQVENSILYDYISNQSNIVHFDLDGDKKSSKVNCPSKVLDFNF